MYGIVIAMHKPTLRTPETEQKYQDRIAEGALNNGCVLCRAETLQQFEHWRIILNDFPYDRIAKTHHMILPLRHTAEINEEERMELEEIKKTYINEQYNYVMESVNRQKSIPSHYHLQLILLKE